jgi:putative flippase GtrA
MTNTPVILRFLVVGASTALLYFGLTFLLVEGLTLQTTLASTIAYIVTVCYNYLLHYHWTFVSDAPHGQVLVKYLLTCVGGLVLNGLIMHVGVMLLSAHYMVVQIIAAGAVVCWSLFVSTLWVFAKK